MTHRLHPPNEQTDGRLLGAAVRAVRRRRGLTVKQVAHRMNLPTRTYEFFEGGGGRTNLDYIHRFAAVTDSDPFALIMGLGVGSTEFARRCADNKLMLIFIIALQEFEDRMGDRIQHLDPRTLIEAFTQAFRTLDEESLERAKGAETWIEAGREQLSAKRPRPGR